MITPWKMSINAADANAFWNNQRNLLCINKTGLKQKFVKLVSETVKLAFGKTTVACCNFSKTYRTLETTWYNSIWHTFVISVAGINHVLKNHRKNWPQCCKQFLK